MVTGPCRRTAGDVGGRLSQALAVNLKPGYKWLHCKGRRGEVGEGRRGVGRGWGQLCLAGTRVWPASPCNQTPQRRDPAARTEHQICLRNQSYNLEIHNGGTDGEETQVRLASHKRGLRHSKGSTCERPGGLKLAREVKGHQEVKGRTAPALFSRGLDAQSSGRPLHVV
jgi:hypothetical protein